MSEMLPLRWLASEGWLVLTAGADPLSEIRALALGRSRLGGAVAYVSLADDEGDALMEDLAELGAPSGYLVDLEAHDNNEIHERLSGADMIVIEAGAEIDRLKRLMTHTVRHALKSALDSGALLLMEGLAAELAGSVHLTAKGGFTPGLKYVQDALILTDVSDFSRAKAGQRLQELQPDAVCIAIERGAALALGPDRQVETWGDMEVTIGFSSVMPMFAAYGGASEVE